MLCRLAVTYLIAVAMIFLSCSTSDPSPGDSTQKPDDPTGTEPEVDAVEDKGCLPNCTDKQCGSNGCGGQCGKCALNAICVSGVCEKMMPNFNTPCSKDKQCDSGYCMMGPGGKVCSMECALDEQCPDQWLCVERPGTCPDCIFICEWDCTPLCDVKECGADGCGDFCGDCPPNTICLEGQCT
jgi:hypothetical protein